LERSDRLEGVILRGVGGFYYVWDGAVQHECRARGRFRRDKITPTVGDRVLFTPEKLGAEESYGYLEEILPRTSELARPPLANIDLIIAVIAAVAPNPDLLLLDKLLIGASEAAVDAAVCINKTDLATAADVVEEYRLCGYDVFALSASSGEGVAQMRGRLSGHIAAFAGQSGVGKSSLINALEPDMNLKTGAVSRIERGRHTTRHCELLLLPGGGLLADTPGFSLLESETVDPLELKEHYPEFAPYEGLCRFDGCSHRSEPGCAVREAAREGRLSIGRLERYEAIFLERKERWDHRYG